MNQKMKNLTIILSLALFSLHLGLEVGEPSLKMTQAEALKHMQQCVFQAQGLAAHLKSFIKTFSWEALPAIIRAAQVCLKECDAFRYLKWPNNSCPFLVGKLAKDITVPIDPKKTPLANVIKILSTFVLDLEQISKFCVYSN